MLAQWLKLKFQANPDMGYISDFFDFQKMYIVKSWKQFFANSQSFENSFFTPSNIGIFFPNTKCGQSFRSAISLYFIRSVFQLRFQENCVKCFIVLNPIPDQSLLNGVLACFSYLACSRAWHALRPCMVGVLTMVQ